MNKYILKRLMLRLNMQIKFKTKKILLLKYE